MNCIRQLVGSGLNDAVALFLLSFDDPLELGILHGYTFVLGLESEHHRFLVRHHHVEATFLFLQFEDLLVQVSEFELVAGADALTEIGCRHRNI